MYPRFAGAIVLATIIVTAAAPVGAAERCGARMNPKTGAVEVKATRISGSPRWGGAAGSTLFAFTDEASCFRRGRLKDCHLGAPGTLAAITPPPDCRICVGDGGSDGCCAFIRGCTPGVRLGDASFPPADPRFASSGDLTGVWRRMAGTLFASNTSSDAEALVLNADGTGSLNLREPASAALTCGDLLHARTDATLIFDLRPFNFGTRMLTITQPDADSLVLRDAAGDAATFVRATAVPEDCRHFTVNARFDGLAVAPHGFAGLTFDGTQLWYEEDNKGSIFPVDPATGVVGAPVDLGASQFSHVHAMQGASFWTRCGCGGDESVQRRTAEGALVDTVNTETDLTHEINVSALAYDDVADVLYLHGLNRDTGERQLLRVNSNAEPDVLLSAVDFPARIRSMTWDGANLWALVGFGPQVVIRMDVDAAKAVATYSVPDTSVAWTGIASVGSQLFLVGGKRGAGVLVGVTP